MKTIIKNILVLIIFFSIAAPSFAATYYVSADGNDRNPGTESSRPWKRCPGMAGWSGSTRLQAGDTVYFNSSDTWTLSGGSCGLRVKGGVTYIGDTWGNGKRAKFNITGRYSPAAVGIWEDHPTIETEFNGFEVDLNMTESFIGIQFNNGSRQGSKTVGAIKRVKNCHVHHTGRNGATYGIAASTHHNSTTKNIEIIDCIVHDTAHSAIVLYAGYEANNALIANVIIRGCKSYRAGLRPSSAGCGITIKNHVENVVIENNQLHDNTNGLLLCNTYSGALPVRNITIRYNEISSNKNVGLVASPGPVREVDIYGNLISNNGRQAVYFTRRLQGSVKSRILNNTFISPSDTCITDLKNAITKHSYNTYYSRGNGSLVTTGGRSYNAANIKSWESTAKVADFGSQDDLKREWEENKKAWIAKNWDIENFIPGDSNQLLPPQNFRISKTSN